MIVRLTHAQGNAVMHRAPEDVAAAMLAHREVYGRAKHSYILPAIGWRRALDAMLATCYGPAGGKLKSKNRPPDSAYGAIREIAQAVKRIEGHPAFREAAVMGWVGDVVPAFVSEDVGGYLQSPYPAPGWRFALLTPIHVEMNGRKATSWGPASPTERSLLEPQSLAYQEDFHLLLQGGAVPS